jgi:hypothetical protein
MRWRGYVVREAYSSLSPVRAFTPVFDGLWERDGVRGFEPIESP